MRFRKRKPFLSILLDTGLQLLDSVRERLPDDMDDMKDRVRTGYGTASERVSHAANALRGEKESHIAETVGTLLIGVGIGVGIGLLVAPASGDETRRDLNDKVSDFSDKVRERTGKNRRAQLKLTANKNGPLDKTRANTDGADSGLSMSAFY